ncbi:hypothetical protein OFO16_24045 [Vibrio natriegens]|uniref:hypothetical protein n=1 Tax=Vibrio natriegens TaxID=691 RepID=UPI0021E72C5E|nr:hypothetical protein [Vibrio natriegens]UYI49431.1 hypothetical protein OFO16_24045 [Vibrio natriegens]
MKKLSLTVLMTAVISTSLMAETIYNGDVIQGRKVITKLDVKDFDNNSVSELFFRAGDQINTSQYYYVPVTVIKGKLPGALLLKSMELNQEATI